MATSLTFSALDVRRDNNRFGGSYFYFEKNGQPIDRTLYVLMEVNHDRWQGQRHPSAAISWSNPDLNIMCRNLLTGETKEFNGRRGISVQMTPAWTHKGYTMYNTPRSPHPRCAWVSMAAHRQYRWGLSGRAFEQRHTSGFPHSGSLGNDGIEYVIAYIFKHGPSYVDLGDIDLSRGTGTFALTPTLAVHSLAPNVGTLVHNARTVLGFHYNGTLRVEHQAKDLTRAIRNQVTYVPTAKLTSLFSSRILAKTMQPAEPNPVPPEGSIVYDDIESGPTVRWTDSTSRTAERDRAFRNIFLSDAAAATSEPSDRDPIRPRIRVRRDR